MTRTAPWWLIVAFAVASLAPAGAMMVRDVRETARTFWPGDVRVIDGDTLEAQDGETIRLWGVDAPETGSPGGAAATRALQILTHGRDLRCERIDLDPYGRTVARCRLGAHDVDLACRMVGLGYARDWPRYSGGAYADC